MAEHRGFVFSIIFLVFFTAMLGTAPSGLITGYTPSAITNFNPQLLAGFGSTESYMKDNYSTVGSLMFYDYSLGGWYWRAYFTANTFGLGAKVLIFGFWFGALDYCTFTNAQGQSRGTSLSFTELDADATNGQVRYSADHNGGGGGLVFSWNSTAYTSSSDAWTAGELYILHGLGVDDSAPGSILGLLLGLLFFQLPDVPFLIYILIDTPVWANILYISWYIIKEVIPFV